MLEQKSREKLRNQYTSDGLVLVEDVIPKQVITHLEQSIDEILGQFAGPDETRDDLCIRLNDENQEKLYEINKLVEMTPALHRTEAHLEDIVTSLYPQFETTLTVQTNILIGLPDDERLSYGWHQESAYHTATDELLNFWYPLFEPSTTENGAMELLKGSQVHGSLPYEEHKMSDNSRTTRLPENIDTIEDEHETVTATMDLGSVICFGDDMIHRSGSNLTDRVRFTGVTRMVPTDNIVSRRGEIADYY